MSYRFDAGPEWGKCTFIRMLGSDAEDDIPQELLCFVHQIRRLCAAYGLFDEDGGNIAHLESLSTESSKLPLRVIHVACHRWHN